MNENIVSKQLSLAEEVVLLRQQLALAQTVAQNAVKQAMEIIGVDSYCPKHSGVNTLPFDQFTAKVTGQCLCCLIDENALLKQGWTPLEKGVPPTGDGPAWSEPVLVQYQSGQIGVESYFQPAKGPGFFYSKMQRGAAEPVAWRPLPPTYQPGEKK